MMLAIVLFPEPEAVYAPTLLEETHRYARIAMAVAAKEHFVKQVMKDGKAKFGETLPAPNAQRVLNQQQINDETYAMSMVDKAHPSVDGYQTATKTGTWEYNQSETENAHAWNVGFTTQLAAEGDSAWDETSIAQAPHRRSTISRRRACTSGASGVVCAASRRSAPIR